MRTFCLVALCALALHPVALAAESTAPACGTRLASARFIPVEGTIADIAIDDRCERVFFTNATANRVETFELATLARGEPLPIGAGPTGGGPGDALDPQGRLAYRLGSAQIDVLDLALGTATRSLPLQDSVERAADPGSAVGQLALSRDGSLLAVVTDHGFTLFPTGVPEGTRFEDFQVQIEIRTDLGLPDDVIVRAELALGAASDGIDPLGEPLVLHVGAATVRVPAGSIQFDQGRFLFLGVLDGNDVSFTLESLGENRFELLLQTIGDAVGVNGTALPPVVSLQIGDDAGVNTLSQSRLRSETLF
jgi:hypothetical protein